MADVIVVGIHGHGDVAYRLHYRLVLCCHGVLSIVITTCSSGLWAAFTQPNSIGTPRSSWMMPNGLLLLVVHTSSAAFMRAMALSASGSLMLCHSYDTLAFSHDSRQFSI